jgi:hypothetical protein
MDTCQIEITNACHNSCSNCTRLCGHHKKPYFMSLDKVKKAIDSMVGYPNMTGIMGGEPLLHPQFEEICKYMQTKLPKVKCGLWTCLPEGKEHYREIIVETFEHIFINDHTRDDILHGPVLVASRELPIEDWQREFLYHKCWVQNSWSASINEKGAWFCEVAASLATLLDVEGAAWPVETGWWARSPQHFVQQMSLCDYCGCAMPLKRRASIEEIDDVSPKMLEILKLAKSPKVKKGKYEVHNLQLFNDDRQCATYKDEHYRNIIAKKYGLFLMLNEMKFQTPYLTKNWTPECLKKG